MIIERQGIRANIVNDNWVVLTIYVSRPLVFFGRSYLEAKANWEQYALNRVHLASLVNRGTI